MINYNKIKFNCPYCQKQYNDSEDKYVNRCNNNKNHCTKIKCSCGKWFEMTYTYMCQAIGFKLLKDLPKNLNKSLFFKKNR